MPETRSVALIDVGPADGRSVLDLPAAQALRTALEAAAGDAAIRVVMLRPAGRNFLVGGDVATLAAALGQPAEAGMAMVQALVGEANRAVALIRGMDKPVIAAVHGAAAGFGLSLAAACDLVVADATARFVAAYVGLGTSPDGGATHSLLRLLGPRRATELALLNERIDAPRALELGLVNRVVPAGEAPDAARQWAERLAAGPGSAIGRTKRLLVQAERNGLAEQLEAEAREFAASFRTEDFAEGVRAFMEKRMPQFQGR